MVSITAACAARAEAGAAGGRTRPGAEVVHRRYARDNGRRTAGGGAAVPADRQGRGAAAPTGRRGNPGRGPADGRLAAGRLPPALERDTPHLVVAGRRAGEPGRGPGRSRSAFGGPTVRRQPPLVRPAGISRPRPRRRAARRPRRITSGPRRGPRARAAHPGESAFSAGDGAGPAARQVVG